ncbi:glutaredoxin domain-containing protein [Jeotgalibacillus sp. ET6]|uniref:glutaredoxin domain-containing protein n=1 Tax=Jeotgalibacillus sp. ET6 TaxID=3037260 RepID=UPI00241874AE|nr:glutaredoxin domain-containing protein [Jeotgalibacillus sp. ET6]MDG5470113.1 glutaredoxin domain-containing protein [Jeotgalibacillus sp. ET6]
MHKVVLYTQPQCPPCEIVKRFLQAYDIKFDEINIKEDQKAKLYMLNELEAYSTPTVVVNEQEIIRGFNLEELASALNIECE